MALSDGALLDAALDMAPSDAAMGVALIAVSAAGSDAGLLQAAKDRAATPAAIIRAVFIGRSPL